MIDLNDYGRKTWHKKRKSDYPQVLPVKLPTMPKIEIFKDLTLKELIKHMHVVESERLTRAEEQIANLFIMD